jgi:ABC-type sugar transport system ATPase subunit
MLAASPQGHGCGCAPQRRQEAVVTAQAPPTLVVRGLTKRFGGVLALADVDLDVRRGEVVAIAGENGAGKSTLVNILGGMWRADEGEISLDGKFKVAVVETEPKSTAK